MIPRLYDAATNTSGLSAEGTILSDVISCVVTEERNGAFEIKMVISKDDQRFSEIEIGKILTAKPNETDDDQHAHFHCEVCHRTFCLQEIPVPEVALPEGYTATSASYLIKGICPACARTLRPYDFDRGSLA